MFTLLMKSPKEILALDRGKFKAPPPTTTPVEIRNNNKFCEFHREVGHNTDECMHLKRQIKELIKARKLVARQRVTQSFSPDPEISFPLLGDEDGTKGLMIIEAEVRGPEAQPSASTRAATERIKVAIHPKYPKQTIAIGFTLTDEGRKELCGLLRCNLVIFAWKPADMTGVPRHIAEHRLNVREGCPPVRQKKRSQALERNKAIQEKVERLVEAGIMKEFYYHSWLSSPVMNAEATYQCLVDKAFQKQTDRNLEVYVDDLVIKSRAEQEIIRDIEEIFKTLREINMKLNPKKCTFGVEESMFLGYIVNTKGIKVYPDKVEAVLSLPSPKCLKDTQRLNGKLASLHRFLAKSAEKSLPLFKTLKKRTKKSDFKWITAAETAFK
ncbi:reverse transcriptase domain-containing protein [Tanacetum coccineum]